MALATPQKSPHYGVRNAENSRLMALETQKNADLWR